MQQAWPDPVCKRDQELYLCMFIVVCVPIQKFSCVEKLLIDFGMTWCEQHSQTSCQFSPAHSLHVICVIFEPERICVQAHWFTFVLSMLVQIRFSKHRFSDHIPLIQAVQHLHCNIYWEHKRSKKEKKSILAGANVFVRLPFWPVNVYVLRTIVFLCTFWIVSGKRRPKTKIRNKTCRIRSRCIFNIGRTTNNIHGKFS